MLTNIEEKKEIRFKAYEQDFEINLPVQIKDLVTENAQIQIIDKLIESIPMDSLTTYYCGIGCPPYHPKMLIKVWVYGYCQGVYTTRPLAKKLREDIGFMYLSGGQHPNFKTLSNFRTGRMGDLMESVLHQILVYLVEQDLVDLSDLYIDGSKWEANNNKYKRVWGKNTARYKSGVSERVRDLLNQYQALQDLEDAQYGQQDLSEHQGSEEIAIHLTSSDLAKRIENLCTQVAKESDKAKAKKADQLSKKLEKEQEKLFKYEEQEEKLGSRNSYGKTDTDATMMRMKDDSLLPGYNVQITSNNQYIIHSSMHQNSSDSVTLQEHWQGLEEKIAPLLEENTERSVTLDAGYGSEENYDFFEHRPVTAYLKYPLWYKDISGQLAKRAYYYGNWFYNADKDEYICPNGQQLVFIKQEEKQTKNGYIRNLKVYQSQSCQDCPFFKQCRGEKAKTDTNRTISISPKLEEHKQKAKLLLASEEGKKKRSQRSTDVETPFGDIKHNGKHRRFYLRGKEKVGIEFNFLAIAHNIRKIECQETGKYKEYYAQRAAKRAQMKKKRA